MDLGMITGSAVAAAAGLLALAALPSRPPRPPAQADPTRGAQSP
jgi:hypothetical protein